MAGVNINDSNDIETISLWGVRGLRIMVENLHERIIDIVEENPGLLTDLDVAANDVLVKAMDVESAVKRVVESL